MTSETLDRLNHAKLVERYVVTTRQRDDLLAALEAVMGWYDSGTIARTMRDVGETAAHDKTVREARAAIAPAKEG